jgi:hypothetical protein
MASDVEDLFPYGLNKARREYNTHGRKRNSCIILVGSSEREISFGISRHRQNENVLEKQNLRVWASVK